MRVRMIARIRVGGRDDENSTAYLLLRMAGARGLSGFLVNMASTMSWIVRFWVSRHTHDPPIYHVKSLPNG
ncbi:MAG: hypothetical protein LZ169_02740 [Thaumarchaeota archaeon]|nr:hypothetical protein [Candidatus Wolframiiraptor allenii]